MPVSAYRRGHFWSENSRENTLTPWSNDPVTDPAGEVRFALGAGVDNADQLYFRAGQDDEWALLNDEGVSGRDVVPANGAQVTDALPAGLAFVSASGCSYDGSSRQVVCVIASLAAGASVDFTVRVRVDSPYTGPATLSNTACVDMPADPVGGNNCSTTPKTVGTPPPTSIPTLSEWGMILLSMLNKPVSMRIEPGQLRKCG